MLGSLGTNGDNEESIQDLLEVPGDSKRAGILGSDFLSKQIGSNTIRMPSYGRWGDPGIPPKQATYSDGRFTPKPVYSDAGGGIGMGSVIGFLLELLRFLDALQSFLKVFEVPTSLKDAPGRWVFWGGKKAPAGIRDTTRRAFGDSQ